MPQDPTIAESAKQRSLRVPLDYLAQGDSLVRFKWLISFAFASAAALYVVWLMVDRRAGERHASPGPLAGVHAAWNDDCRACHLNFHPLRSDAVDLVSLIRGSGGAAHRETFDQACVKCHNEPRHHAIEKADEVATCAACHREHGGPAAAIVRPADSQCTSCHAEINSHRDGASGLAPQVANVTGFGALSNSSEPPHPPFRSLDDDPGNIKFNHWLHLQPGIAVADGKQKKRLADLTIEQRSAYTRFASQDGLVQLDCSACHQPSARGDTMQPIAFEQHCRACHPLRLNFAEEEAAAAELPHGLSAARLSVVLDGLLLTQERGKTTPPPATTDESGALPLVPGKTLGSNLANKLGQDVLQRRGKAAVAVAARCEQCHTRASAAKPASSDGLLDVLPTRIPTPWFAHARFDHSAHRHVECRTCHASAYAFEQRDKPQFLYPASLSSGYTPARDNEQVMISGIETCATCHAPRRGSTGGARHDCAECHLYHGRDAATVGHLWFPGSSLGTHDPEAPALSAARKDVDSRSTDQRGRASGQLRPREDPGTQATHFVSHLAEAESLSPRFLGARTCSSSGCHGDVQRNAPVWRSAFTTWLDRDPHVQAYDVLWTFRGREMTRLLDPRPANGEQPQPLTDEQHAQALQLRCIACHATPSPLKSKSLETHALGVQCESCHGPAENWLHAHYRARFDRQKTTGFVDTKDLNARAATCMPCHVGPNDAAGEPQVVDHDLIAAGHPRLNFELHAYFENLPAHWDRRQDEQRHAPDFHYRTWLAGETKQTEHVKSLLKMQARPWPDFALLDCAACHHSLGSSDWRQRSGLSLLTARRPFPDMSATDAQGRVAWANEVLAAAADVTQKTTHDEAIRGYLAVRAVLVDLSPESAPIPANQAAVGVTLRELGGYLARECYGIPPTDPRWPSSYETPTRYDPGLLADRVQPVQAWLQQLKSGLMTPIREP